jgi:hypothetical protein
MKAIAIGVSLATLVTVTAARAEGPHGEVSALVGYGTPAFDSHDNNFGPGVGARAGASFGKLWLGATVTCQFGSPTSYWDVDSHGNEVQGSYSLSTLAAGGEIGWSFRAARSAFGSLVIRPYAWVGANVYFPSPLNGYHSNTDPKDPIVRFAVAPSLHVDYELARSGIFFGTDVRVNLLVPGKAPEVVGPDGYEYAVDSWYTDEHLTAELSIFAVVGKRF